MNRMQYELRELDREIESLVGTHTHNPRQRRTLMGRLSRKKWLRFRLVRCLQELRPKLYPDIKAAS